MDRKRKLSILEIILLSLGSPIWLSVILALIAVILSIYISLWSIIISLWAIFVSLIASAFGGIFASIVFAFTNNLSTGFALLGASLVLIGIGIFVFFGCKFSTKYFLILTKKIIISIKNSLIKKEAVL